MVDSTLGLIGGILLAAALSAAIVLVQRRRRRQSWAGTVTKIRTYSEDDGVSYVRISYLRTDGVKRRLDVKEYTYRQLFPDLKDGDKLVKAAGEDLPKKA